MVTSHPPLEPLRRVVEALVQACNWDLLVNADPAQVDRTVNETYYS